MSEIRPPLPTEYPDDVPPLARFWCWDAESGAWITYQENLRRTYARFASGPPPAPALTRVTSTTVYPHG